MDSDQDLSDDNEDEWTYPESTPRKGATKKIKKERVATSSPHRSGRGPGRPPKQTRERAGRDHHHLNRMGEGGVYSDDFHSLKVSTNLIPSYYVARDMLSY